MKKAILHIGTEKTGTTSIQLYLFENRRRLAKQGFLFPKTCDYLSSRKLVIFAKSRPDVDLINGLGFNRDDAEGVADWKARFVADHCQEVTRFQSKHPTSSTTIYSSEHLQSRLKTVEEIERVGAFLQPMYDQIEIIVYLRRQDRHALSAHSTTLRAGRDSDFAFENVNAAGPYYNQLKLLEDWTNVFGEDSITARIFERNRLLDQDVLTDFCAETGLPYGTPGMVVPEAQNEALSHTAKCLLRCFNRMPDDDAHLAGLHRGMLRAFLLGRLETITDEYGRCLPSRSSAETFMSHYTEANKQVSARWLDGMMFDNCFAEYPLEASMPPPIADAESQLRALIAEFRQRSRSRFA